LAFGSLVNCRISNDPERDWEKALKERSRATANEQAYCRMIFAWFVMVKLLINQEVQFNQK